MCVHVPVCMFQFYSGIKWRINDLRKLSAFRCQSLFFCGQDDFSWVCMKEQCDVLQCPPDVQMVVPGQCCPSCPGRTSATCCSDQLTHFRYTEQQCLVVTTVSSINTS